MTDIRDSIEMAEAKRRISQQFANDSNLTFRSIENEALRGYEFPGGARVIIPDPIASVSPVPERHGGSRTYIIDIDGVGHYIPGGWVHLWIEPKPGEKAF